MGPGWEGGAHVRKKGPNEGREGKGGMEKKKGPCGEGRGRGKGPGGREGPGCIRRGQEGNGGTREDRKGPGGRRGPGREGDVHGRREGHGGGEGRKGQ